MDQPVRPSSKGRSQSCCCRPFETRTACAPQGEVGPDPKRQRVYQLMRTPMLSAWLSVPVAISPS